MSSFVVGSDHIDYLVSAVLLYAPRRMGGRTGDQLGRQLLAENVASVTAQYLDAEDEDMDAEELAELLEERAAYDELVSRYEFRKVELVEPAQAAWVAACWQYQRGRYGLHDLPETWVTADDVIATALALVGLDRLKDPAGPRTIDNLRTDDLAWIWSRASHRG